MFVCLCACVCVFVCFLVRLSVYKNLFRSVIYVRNCERHSRCEYAANISFRAMRYLIYTLVERYYQLLLFNIYKKHFCSSVYL